MHVKEKVYRHCLEHYVDAVEHSMPPRHYDNPPKVPRSKKNVMNLGFGNKSKDNSLEYLMGKETKQNKAGELNRPPTPTPPSGGTEIFLAKLESMHSHYVISKQTRAALPSQSVYGSRLCFLKTRQRCCCQQILRAMPATPGALQPNRHATQAMGP